MILDKIVAQKKKRLQEAKNQMSQAAIISQLDRLPTGAFSLHTPFISPQKELSLIAEIKKASPSKGIMKADFDPIQIACDYTANQVEAISVLTEEDYFLGKSVYLKQVRQVTALPLLRKDFIIDPYQLYESKLLGANAILLIVAILDQAQLKVLLHLSKELGLHVLVEVHNQQELEQALLAKAQIIGINNRDLKTFTTSLETTANLIEAIPSDKIVISESGIHNRAHMETLKALGVDGVLIGEVFMRADSITEKIRELRGD